MCSAIVLPDRPSGEWSPESKKNEMKKFGAPSVVEPHSGPIVVVPLPLCPWFLQSVMMYAKDQSCDLARAGVGAALLRVLGTRQVVVL